MRALLPSALVGAGLLAGCATTSIPTPDPSVVEKVMEDQRRLAIEMERERLSTLHGLAWPILQANQDFCEPRVTPAIGVVLTTIKSFAPSMREQVARDYGVGNKPVVWVLVGGAPADEAGLELGDQIELVNGDEPVPKVLEESLGKSRNEDSGDGDTTVTLTVKRGDEQLEIRIEPETICNASIHLALSNVVNAWTDGRSITVSSGMMRFVADDSELQYTIAHELAHMVEHHVRKTVGHAVIAIPIDTAALAWRVLTLGRYKHSLMHRFSQSLEREADYISLYMLARAGVRSDRIQEFWNRMAIELPKRIDYGSTHPSSAERYANLSVTQEEIDRKIEHGEPLIPERRNQQD